jgi:phosphoribosyl-AMP cyclohydrolase
MPNDDPNLAGDSPEQQLSHDKFIAEVKFDATGLVASVAQDATTNAVLMVAWMNEEALRLTLSSGDVTYWSRSRAKLWRKGETSGHTQKLQEARIDCDGDTLLLKVDQTGPACHTGAPNCFFRQAE